MSWLTFGRFAECGWGSGNDHPITLLVSGVRGLMHGDVTMAQFGWVLLSCLLLVGVFGPLTMRRYRGKNGRRGTSVRSSYHHALEVGP